MHADTEAPHAQRIDRYTLLQLVDGLFFIEFTAWFKFYCEGSRVFVVERAEKAKTAEVPFTGKNKLLCLCSRSSMSETKRVLTYDCCDEQMNRAVEFVLPSHRQDLTTTEVVTNMGELQNVFLGKIRNSYVPCLRVVDIAATTIQLYLWLLWAQQQ